MSRRCWTGPAETPIDDGVVEFARIPGTSGILANSTTCFRFGLMDNVFDTIRSVLTPERLLHDDRATGQGVVVAVLDSGIERTVLEAKHPHSPRIDGGIFLAERNEPLAYEGKQSTPHGTTVADIILTMAP